MRGGEIFVPKIPSMKITDLAAAMAPGRRIEVVGIRPGEKLHEMMISADDARSTVELGDRYAIEPAFVEYPRTPFRSTAGRPRCPRTSPTPATPTPTGCPPTALMAMVRGEGRRA